MPALLKGFLEQTFRSRFIFPDAKPDERLFYAPLHAARRENAAQPADAQFCIDLVIESDLRFQQPNVFRT